MIRFLTDNDFDERIVRGLLRRRAHLDIIRVRDVGLRTAKDPDILAWAADAGRILLTHDKKTMPDHAYNRVQAGQAMPGVFVVLRSSSFSEVIDDIIVADELTGPDEWQGRVEHIPL